VRGKNGGTFFIIEFLISYTNQLNLEKQQPLFLIINNTIFLIYVTLLKFARNCLKNLKYRRYGPPMDRLVEK
jgi:DNA topoisomerase VI subunit B